MSDMDLTVTIAGSYRKHLSAILRARDEFLENVCRVLRPVSGGVKNDAGAFVQLWGDPDDPAEAAQEQLRAIRHSDLVYVVNPGGYIGASAMMEIGYACALGIPVLCAEPPFEAAAAAHTYGIDTPRRVVGRMLHERLAPADAKLLEDVARGRGPASVGHRDGIALRAEQHGDDIAVLSGDYRAVRSPDGAWDMTGMSAGWSAAIEWAVSLPAKAAA